MNTREKIEGKSGEILFYKAEDGRISLDVRLDQDSIWLSQKQMANLFDRDSDTVGLHIRNIYEEGELPESGNNRGFSGSSIGGQAQGEAQHKLL